MDDEARQTALRDLDDLLTDRLDATGVNRRGDTVSDQLGVIGIALARMTARVSTQQTELNHMVKELRDALQVKTQLISLQQELDVARRLQTSVLPQVYPAMEGFDVAASMDPANEVGGDFFDIFEITPGRIGLVVADVSGKGVPAAFFMLITRTLLKAIALNGSGPAATVGRVNTLLSAENPEFMFVTMFYAELDTASGALGFCNAGHNPPLLVRADNSVEVTQSAVNPALAMVDTFDFVEGRLKLQPDEYLLAYTDGVTEAIRNETELFGEERLIDEASHLRGMPMTQVIERVAQAVNRFAADEPQADDITLLALGAAALNRQ